MAQGAGLFKKLVAVVCIGGSALAIYNVNFDVAPLQSQAEATACDGKPCQLISMERRPHVQTFRFHIRDSKSTATVECTRALLLLGDYSCEKVP